MSWGHSLSDILRAIEWLFRAPCLGLPRTHLSSEFFSSSDWSAFPKPYPAPALAWSCSSETLWPDLAMALTVFMPSWAPLCSLNLWLLLAGLSRRRARRHQPHPPPAASGNEKGWCRLHACRLWGGHLTPADSVGVLLLAGPPS